MIAYLKGKVIHKSSYLIVEVNQIGYQVFTPTNVLAKAKQGEEITLFTHQHVREDALELYGFLLFDNLQFFKQLISISGIGPKTALGVLAQFAVKDIKNSIVHQDSSLLIKVPGIGKRTAERLILELKDKLDILPGATYQSPSPVDEEAADALVSLGYSKREAIKALVNLEADLSVEQKIKQALKNLGKAKVK